MDLNKSHKPTILIVEDDPAQLADYAAKLDALGYDVAVATTAEDGIFIAERKRFDIILTDNVLPGMTGLSSIPKLLSRSTARIFLMTSHPNPESEKDSFLLGARAYFKKPLDFQQVHLQFQNAITESTASKVSHPS